MTKEQIVANMRIRATKTRRYGQYGVVGSAVVGVLVLSIFLRAPVLGGDFSAKDFSSAFATSDGFPIWVPLLAAALTKVGAVLISIFVVQVLIQFTKYNLRVADHWDSIADSIEFFVSDERLLNTMLAAISPRHISFGKDPSTPLQEVVSLTTEAIKLAKEKA